MIQLVFACGFPIDISDESKSLLPFGSGNGLPWARIDQDFINFKNRTLNTHLVMGAKTFESLPKKLPDRKHIVMIKQGTDKPVARNGDKADRYVYYNDANNKINHLKIMAKSDVCYSVIGGASLLELASNYCVRVVVTHINTPLVNTPDVFINYRTIADNIKSFLEVESNYCNVNNGSIFESVWDEIKWSNK